MEEIEDLSELDLGKLFKLAELIGNKYQTEEEITEFQARLKIADDELNKTIEKLGLND